MRQISGLALRSCSCSALGPRTFGPPLQPISGEKGPTQRVRHQFVPKVHMRIAATCLSVKQAVGYAADPGRAVGRGGSWVWHPHSRFRHQAASSRRNPPAHASLLYLGRTKKTLSGEARAGHVAVRKDAARAVELTQEPLTLTKRRRHHNEDTSISGFFRRPGDQV